LYTYEGFLSVLGKNSRIDRDLILQEVGFVPQLPPPLKMTVAEIMDFFAIVTKTEKERFITIANDLKLDVNSHLSKPFLKLSGGMKQKLLVSLALARSPKILLMDEPSANLDPEAREVLFRYLKDLPEDTLMILSSHRVDEIKDLVNRLIEMDLGEIVVDKQLIPIV
jgi:ABC-2 type transport system ATP-binding protein